MLVTTDDIASRSFAGKIAIRTKLEITDVRTAFTDLNCDSTLSANQFLPRNAMLARYMQWRYVCLSVRPTVLSQAGVLSEWLNVITQTTPRGGF